MAYENKILRLLAGVKTKEQMDLLFKYFKEKNIDIGEEYVRTALNIYMTLPKSSEESSA
jgi:hypothetical protein